MSNLFQVNKHLYYFVHTPPTYSLYYLDGILCLDHFFK